MTDNFLVAFDDAGVAVLGTVYTDEEPAGSVTPSFLASDGGDLVIEDVDSTDVSGTIVWVSLIPFPLVAGLFLEAEDGTITGGARYFGEPAGASNYLRVSSAGADVGNVLTIIGDVGGVRTRETITLNGVAWVNGGVDFDRVYILRLSPLAANNVTVEDEGGANVIHVIPAGVTHVDNAVLLTAQDERVSYIPIVGNDLPAGRYLVFVRMYDTAHIADDVRQRFYDTTKALYLHEEGEWVYYTLGASYLYYGVVGDIPEGSVADLSLVLSQVWKSKADVNTIYVDSFLLIPIGDGEDWPQDLSHAAMRGFTKPRRLYVR
jgi:hypothetical protein